LDPGRVKHNRGVAVPALVVRGALAFPAEPIWIVPGPVWGVSGFNPDRVPSRRLIKARSLSRPSLNVCAVAVRDGAVAELPRRVLQTSAEPVRTGESIAP
jgi:hypothetical protein